MHYAVALLQQQQQTNIYVNVPFRELCITAEENIPSEKEMLKY